MRFIGQIREDGEMFACAVECSTCEVRPRADSFCVEMEGLDASIKFAIIGSEMGEGKRHYKMLSKQEAERIVELAGKEAVVDLNKLGKYQITKNEVYKTVYIRNDFDEYTDEDIPIIVDVPKD